MGRTWKKKKERGHKGHPHGRPKMKKVPPGLGKAKLRRALRAELELTPARLDKLNTPKKRG